MRHHSIAQHPLKPGTPHPIRQPKNAQAESHGKAGHFCIRVKQLVVVMKHVWSTASSTRGFLVPSEGAPHAISLCGTRHDRGGNGSMSFIQKRRGLLSILAGLLLAGGLAGGILSSTASPAAAQSTVAISLANSSSYCVNIPAGRNVSGTPIQLWKFSGKMTSRFIALHVRRARYLVRLGKPPPLS